MKQAHPSHSDDIKGLPCRIWSPNNKNSDNMSPHKVQKHVRKHKQIPVTFIFIYLFMSPHWNNMMMQFKNNLVCFIVTTEQRNIKIYYRGCGVLNTSVANRDIVDQGCPHCFSLWATFKKTRSKGSSSKKQNKKLNIYLFIHTLIILHVTQCINDI